MRGLALRSVSLLENSGGGSGSQRSEDRTRSVSVSGVPPHVCLPRMASRLGSKSCDGVVCVRAVLVLQIRLEAATHDQSI